MHRTTISETLIIKLESRAKDYGFEFGGGTGRIADGCPLQVDLPLSQESVSAATSPRLPSLRPNGITSRTVLPYLIAMSLSYPR